MWVLNLHFAAFFDTINREHSYKMLKKFLDPDELKITSILMKYVTLHIKNNKTIVQCFTTGGILRRDCLSGIIFILYLSNVLLQKMPTRLHDHDYHDAHVTFPTPTEHPHCHLTTQNSTKQHNLIHNSPAMCNSHWIYQQQQKRYKQSNEEYWSNIKRKILAINETKTIQQTSNITQMIILKSVHTLEHY